MKQFKEISRLIKNLTQKRDHYSGSAHYYQLTVFDRYTNLKSLMRVFCDSQSSHSFTTTENIKFKGSIEFSTPESQVIKTLGNPIVYFENPELQNHSILFYKCFIGNFKTNLELHFYDEKFFMGVYSFNRIKGNADKNKIKNILYEKYKVTGEAGKDDDLVIVDKNSNTVMISDHINYSYIYISGNDEILAELKSNIDHIISIVKNKEKRIERYIAVNL